MILPYGIDGELDGRPVITYLLIALNVAAFVLDAGADEGYAFVTWGFVPFEFRWHTLLTSMFTHASILHLAGNMLFLWIFGPAVEAALRPAKFFLLYLAFGVASTVFHGMKSPAFTADMPLVGASGAIAGIMGAFFVLYPSVRIKTFFWFFVFFRRIPVPAWVVLGVWFALQLLSTQLAVADGVAYEAHIGGFVIGFLVVAFQRYGWDIRRAFSRVQRARAVEDAEVYQQLASPRTALRLIRQTRQEAPDDVLLAYWHAVAALRAGQHEEASGAAAALTADAESPEGAANRWLLLHRLGRLPLDRRIAARLADQLERGGAAAAAVAVLDDFLAAPAPADSPSWALFKKAKLLGGALGQPAAAAAIWQRLATDHAREPLGETAAFELRKLAAQDA
ncbi:MAG TPA: rhomboid family intramembrane serine protease [bacterium]|nr:rhomboid family intramembrane serine protease [bacterium]